MSRKRDQYYRRAKNEGYRSRAAYKLKEINNRIRLMRPGSRVLDLGATPGGWSQVSRDIVGEKGTVVAVDLVPMDAIEGVEFVQGDIEDEATMESVLEICPQFDAVISDASPRLSGNRTLDRGKALALNWVILEISSKVLRKNGGVLIKMFQGTEVDELVDEFGSRYHNFDRMKPKSSLNKSIEIFLAFRGLKNEWQTDDGSV